MAPRHSDRIITAAVALALALAPVASSPALAQARAASPVVHPAWTRQANIYEVNVRQFTPEGTIVALQRHLPRLRRMGVDILWLMPVQPIGREKRKGGLGSYYAVSDYRAINPEFGTERDMRAFIAAAHRLGMKVILDWVPNHTAWDHTWTRTNPDFHERRADGSLMVARDNEGRETDWTDVAELNYANPAMRREMIAALRWWVESMRIDGFRMDVAGGVPLDFWPEARAELRKVRPDLFMLAEAEGPQYHAHFDMPYGWELHHLMNEIAKGKKGTAELDAYLARQDSTFPRDAMRMYFTSNHDENSWQGTEFERMGANHIPSFVLMATMQNGMPLLYTGQEASLGKRLRFFEKDTVDWRGPSLAPFYTSMLALKRTQPALANGAWGARQAKLATDGGDRVYAFTRTKGANTVLVAVNFADAPMRVAYSGLRATGAYRDWNTKRAVTLRASGTLEIPANSYRVLVR